jgi:hypothetical protein
MRGKEHEIIAVKEALQRVSAESKRKASLSPDREAKDSAAAGTLSPTPQKRASKKPRSGAAEVKKGLFPKTTAAAAAAAPSPATPRSTAKSRPELAHDGSASEDDWNKFFQFSGASSN